MVISEAPNAVLPDCPPISRLCLLGGPYAVHGPHRLTAPEGAERLVVFVALYDHRPVRRRKIAGTLWPSVSEERAAGNLRAALWRLNASGLDVLDADKDVLAIKPDVRIDLFELSAWAKRVMTGTAVADDLTLDHVHGAALELLPGWYDEWVVIEREQFRQRLLHALDVLSRRLTLEGRHAEAIEAAVIAAAIEPLRQTTQEALMLAHIAEGNVSEAQRVLDAYARLLHAELGILPTTRLSSLVRAAHSEVRPVHPMRVGDTGLEPMTSSV
ncbi:AfsR/SARP family transcriptional regulator [Planctomonas psychrotolerans]|uniref:AfsR/SARP family transcriptional regulator n=1 Tax=Planctomonas psychrotolerans TaxID=2528712 RepID=UPI00123AB707